MHTELEQIKNIPPAAFRRHLGRIGTSEAYLMQLYKEQEPYERDLISVHHSVAEVVVNPSHYNPDDMEILDRFVHLAMRDTGYGDQLILR